MANTRSAEKRNRQNTKRRARNTHWKTTVRTAVKKVREAVAAKDPKAGDLLKAAEKALKKAASKGVIHARNADRHVGRLAKSLHAAK